MTYDELQEYVADRLWRTDLETEIVTFIEIADASMRGGK